MKTLLMLSIISVTSLIILRTFGIHTEIVIVDKWVDAVMTVLRMA